MDNVPHEFYTNVIDQMTRDSRNEIFLNFPKSSIIQSASVGFQQRQYCELIVHGSEFAVKDDALSARGYYEQLTVWIYDGDGGVKLRKMEKTLFKHRIFAWQPRRIAVVCLAHKIDDLLYQYLMEGQYSGNVEFAADVELSSANNMTGVVMNWCEKEKLEVFALESFALSETLLVALLKAFQAPHFRDLRLRLENDSFWVMERVLSIWKSKPTSLSRKVLNLHMFDSGKTRRALFERDLMKIEAPYPTEYRRIVEKFDTRADKCELFKQEVNGCSLFVYLSLSPEEEKNYQDEFEIARIIHLYFS